MNLAVLAERHVERFGEYPSVVFEGKEFTNAALLRDSGRLATALAQLGVKPGDRVAVMLPNGPEVPLAYGAILIAGGVVVPVVFLLAVPEIAHILADCEAKVVVTSPEFLPNVSAAIADLPAKPAVVVTGGAVDGATSFDALIAQANDRLAIVDRSPEDLAVISYTSGTTGVPKGVMLTHANLLFNAENTANVIGIEPDDVSIGCLPLAHLFGISSTLVIQLFKVRSVILRWFTAEGFFEAMNTYRANTTAFVPTMVQYMLGHPDFDSVDWSSLRWAVVAAAPVPVEMKREFEKRTGAKVLEAYGLTETSPTATIMRLDDPDKPGSCGRAVPNVEVSIQDDDGSMLPAGEQGEVCIKGPNIMAGYYKLPEVTAGVVKDGWFHSGDIGFLDEDGFLTITDRKKDMIIRGGFNIYPRDIEEVLHGHPAVLEAGVVGVPDARMGEEVKAFVVLRPGASAGEEELLAYCRDQLAKYKTPKWIEFIDALPKNAIGKVLKRELRERAAGT
ncbi:MAG TPA: long-chain fatty acid--CoA ligase [Actinomycetota bacterium]